jgi:hypothetical protein
LNSFNDFGLAEPILRALAEEKYVTPTPIQDQTIPLLLAQLKPTVDLVYGRSEVEEHKGWRNLTSRMAKAAIDNPVIATA